MQGRARERFAAHKGKIQNDVIEGAFRVLEDLEAVDESTAAMKALTLEPAEQEVFASAALALRCDRASEGQPPAPIPTTQLLEPRRPEDIGPSLWSTFQRVQENNLRGGQTGRSAQGRRIQTRAIGSIDRSGRHLRRSARRHGGHRSAGPCGCGHAGR